MDHGLYTAYLGLKARERTLDVTANNIANASTAGFKADRLLFRSIEAAVQEQSGQTINGQAANQSLDRLLTNSHGIEVGVVQTGIADFTDGQLQQTGRPLDVALEGDGFLSVQTPQGERYMRAGSLRRDTNGQLVTPQGFLVNGENGPITLPPGEVLISEKGEITVNNQKAGALKLVSFSNPATALIKEGGSTFAATNLNKFPPGAAQSTRVVQGAVEGSNVDPMLEMAAMLQNTREFESLQRGINMLANDLGRKIASEIGKI